MILKNDTQGSFILVRQNIMRDRSLRLFDRGLLITLMSLPDNWSFTINGLASILPDGRDGISRGLERLQEKGYIMREQLRINGKFSDICLKINISPAVPISNRPITEKPITVNPVSEKPSTNIPTQYNNNISNIQESNIQESNKMTCVISERKEAKNGVVRKKRDNGEKECDGKWSRKEIDLYGL